MTSNKVKKPVTLKSLYFFGGIALCFFSICLIMNVLKLARCLTFGPIYLFGIGAYIIYLFIYAIGMSLLFREKGLGIKSFLTWFGIIILFISILMGLTLAYNDSQIESMHIEKYNTLLGNIKDYIAYETNKPLSFYTQLSFIKDAEGNVSYSGYESGAYYGGGMIGLIVCKLFGSLGLGGSWAITILLCLLGLFVIFRKHIISFIKKSIPKKNGVIDDSTRELAFSDISSEGKRSVYGSKPAAPIENRVNVITGSPVNRPIMSNSVPVKSSTDDTFVERPMEKRTTIAQQNVPLSNIGYSGLGVFQPARFMRPGAQSMPTQNPVMEQNSIPQEPLRAEQQFLDFDAKPQLDESLVRARPEFEEPVNTVKPMMVEPEPVQPEPLVQQPFARPISQAQPDPIPAYSQVEVKKPIVWVPPSAEMLESVEINETLELNNKVAEERMAAINEVLDSFRAGAKVESYTVGPAVTRFNIKSDAGVTVKNVERIIPDISIRLGGVSARFEAVVEGQFTSGLEIPNAKITTVSFKEVYEKLPDVKKHPLAVAFGKNIQGDVIWADVNEFPHALVAGTTGSGKSVFINSVITTLIMRNSPDDLKMVLIDPKKVEMTKYKDMPHLLCPVVNDANQAKLVMSKLVDEMNERYEIFEKAEGCTSLKEYNEYAEEKGLAKIPAIVVVVDEYADLVDSCKEIGQPVVMIGQKARACGIHMIISTQRPSTNVITGVIKGNLPTHVALMCANTTDSCTIVGEGGAEKLLGKGDMLVQSPLVSRVGMVRLQSCFIQRKEMMYVVGYLKEHYEVNYNKNFLNLQEQAQAAGQAMVASGDVEASMDPAEEAKYQGVKEWVLTQQYMSMSRIQRECAVGFNRAGRFFIRLQNEGVVSRETEANRGCRVLANLDMPSDGDNY